MNGSRQDRLFARFRRTGDPRALAKLFDDTAPELWRVATWFLRDENLVADAVQGTFLVAVEDAARWDSARAVMPWLIGILVNQARTLRRQAQQVVPAVDREGAGDDPTDAASRSELHAELAVLLPRLASRYRVVLEAQLVHGKAPADIARDLGLRENTVRVRLHRALAQLRRLLPAGFAAGGVVAAGVPAAQLAAMRRVLLARVEATPGLVAAGVGLAGITVLGGLAMKKTMLVTLGAAVVALGVWSTWSGGDATAERGGAPVAPASLQVERSAVVAASAPDSVPAPDAAQRTPVPAAPTARGTLRVRVVNAKTQQPVPHVIVQWNGRRINRGVTDLNGEWVCEDRVGPAKIELVHSNASAWRTKTCDVVADTETRLTFELDPWLRIALRAVDRDRRPIAGARVFANVREAHLPQEVVGTTDADGRFQHESVLRHLEARVEADGCAPSEWVSAYEGKPDVRRTLVLDKPAGTVRGRVLDPAGVPVPGTLIVIQPEQPGSKQPPSPLIVGADAQGCFETRSVPFGTVHVFALADRTYNGLCLEARRRGRAIAEVRPGSLAEVDVRLATTRVVAEFPARPSKIPEHVVADLKEPEIHPNLAWELMGQAGSKGTHRCEISGLAPGHYVLTARLQNRETKLEIDLAADQTFQWQPTLGPAADLKLRVVDASGETLRGVNVHLRREDGSDALPPGYGSSAGGQWGWREIADVSYEVLVYRRDGDGREPIARFPGVRPGPELQTLRVGGEVAATVTGKVRGRVVADGGPLPKDLTVKLMEIRNRARVRETVTPVAADGTFAQGGLAPAEYLIQVQLGQHHVGHAGPRAVVAGGETDFGAVTIRALGALRVRVSAPDGTALGDLRCLVLFEGVFGEIPQRSEQEALSIDPMPVGTWDLLVWGPGVAPARTQARIAANAATEVAVVLEAAPTCTVEFAGTVPGPITLTFRRQGASERFVVAPRAPVDEYAIGLPPGRWSIECRSRGQDAVLDMQDVALVPGSNARVMLRLR